MPLFWVAVYGDGTQLEQYNADGSENAYKDIDREKLAEFNLLLRTPGSPEPVPIFLTQLQPPRQLIYRRRIQKHYNSEGSKGEDIWHLVGWQMRLNGRNVQSIAWVNDRGFPTILRGRFAEEGENTLFSAPIPHPHEGEPEDTS
jgi:hypothetical protein